jgi:hypothetical protein
MINLFNMNLLLALVFSFLNDLSPSDTKLEKTYFFSPDTINPQPSFKVKFRFDTIKSKTATADFNSKYNNEEREIILAINRISSKVIKSGKVLLLPDTLTNQLLNYSPYPDSLKGFDTLPKLILVSRRIQAFAIYEKGILKRWGPVSSGKKSTPTPAGLFHTNFKVKRKVSSENSSWILPWYFNFYAQRGIAFHQYTLPGYPASHACVRMQEKDAKWIFDWADQWKISAKTGSVIRTGTPVIIFGDYDFGGIKPWLNLPNDNQSTHITAKEFEEINSYLPIIHTNLILRK